MNTDRLRKILESVERGGMSVDEAFSALRNLPFEDMDFARLDHHRSIRKGFPEVVYCEGKAPDHLERIVDSFLENRVNMLLTRATEEIFSMVSAKDPEAQHNEKARAVWRVFDPLAECSRPVMVVTAGTSDIGVAEEACVTAEVMGCRAERLYDAGVAGIHRILHNVADLDRAGAIVVVAGMEGALASVVGGLTSKPVIAVPTSVGYGASFGGLSALLGMLNTCAPGVAVVNIDNGFGAGYFAAVVCRNTVPSS